VIVLDASALLALLFREPGHEEVAARIRGSCLSTVNLSEVIGRFVRDGHNAQVVLRRVADSRVEFVPFTASGAALAATLHPTTRSFGLSLADRACLALALERGIPVLTADRAWDQLDIGVTVQVIR